MRGALRAVALAAVLVMSAGAGAPTAAQAQAQAQAQTGEEPAEDQIDDQPQDTRVDKKAVFLTLEPLVAPVLDERNIKGNITVVLKLFLHNPQNEEKIRQRLPIISDAYLNYFYRYGSSAASSGVMQLDAIVRSLQRLSDKALGKGEVQVLIHEISRTRSR